MRNFLILAALLLGTPSLLTACNTVEGVGKDIQGLGNAISGSADSEQDDSD